MRQSNIFFLEEPEKIRAIPQHDYVSLVRGEHPMPDYANRTLRMADWYTKITDKDRVEVENETYSLLAFDAAGFVDGPQCRHGIAVNHAFYMELMESTYSDIDDDPDIQKLREKLGSDFTWYPNKEERASLKKLMRMGKT